MKKILAFAASNSSQSINKKLLSIASTFVEKNQISERSMSEFDLPIYSQDLEESHGFPEGAKQFIALLNEYDAFIIASPEHNGSMPAAFKNLIDWTSRMENSMESPMFAQKPVLLLSTSPGPNGGATNLQNLAQLMPWWGADIRGSYSLGSFYEHLTEQGFSSQKRDEIGSLVADFEASLGS